MAFWIAIHPLVAGRHRLNSAGRGAKDVFICPQTRIKVATIGTFLRLRPHKWDGCGQGAGKRSKTVFFHIIADKRVRNIGQGVGNEGAGLCRRVARNKKGRLNGKSHQTWCYRGNSGSRRIARGPRWSPAPPSPAAFSRWFMTRVSARCVRWDAWCNELP